MKVAVMQPYLFPYIGYFQLIEAVDTFVFYDDVNFIKGGWINRNSILVNRKSYKFKVSLSNVSSFTSISETKIDINKYNKISLKLLKTIEQSYKKAPFFKVVFPLIKELLFKEDYVYISELAIDSVIMVSKYLGLNTNFKISSKSHSESKGLEKMDRLVSICKEEKAANYINPIGGIELYNKEDFIKIGIKLNFLKTSDILYSQYNDEFIPHLSIIDIMMFNSSEDIRKMLNQYTLI